MSMTGKLYGVAPETLTSVGESKEAVSAFLSEHCDNFRHSYLLDSAWHALHYLLTGQSEGGPRPYRLAILGGRIFRNVDLGYGPPTYLTPQEVQEVATALKGLPAERLRARLDLKKMAEANIYRYWGGAGAKGRSEDEEWEHLRASYLELVEFYQEAARTGEAVIFWL